MSENYYYEPKNGHGLPHDPFNSIISPRPIGWISSQSKLGVINLAPYSFFNAFNYTPPIIGFSSIGYKDTVQNIEETGEFVWNLVTKDLIHKMNRTSEHFSKEINEFSKANLEQTNSKLVKPPRVKQSPVNFECKNTQIIQINDLKKTKLKTWLILGEVVAVHIKKNLLKNGLYRTTKANHILRGGGQGDYFMIGEEQLIKMLRPD